MTVLVTLHLTVPTLVTLFTQSSGERSFTHLAHRTTCHVFGDERVIVEYMKFRALFPPLTLLCQRERYQVVLLDTILQGFQNKCGSFVDVRSR